MIKPSAPVARVSLYASAGRRRYWWVAYICPSCGSGHLGRLASPDAIGTRRSGCGRMVRIVVARTYPGKGVPR